MKVREIGEKIGDIEINAPSKKFYQKISIIFSLLYRLLFWGLLIWLTGLFAYTFIIGDKVSPDDLEEGRLQLIGLIFGVVVADRVLKYVTREYKRKTQVL